jgi:hypothetical protein
MLTLITLTVKSYCRPSEYLQVLFPVLKAESAVVSLTPFHLLILNPEAAKPRVFNLVVVVVYDRLMPQAKAPARSSGFVRCVLCWCLQLLTDRCKDPVVFHLWVLWDRMRLHRHMRLVLLWLLSLTVSCSKQNHIQQQPWALCDV